MKGAAFQSVTPPSVLAHAPGHHLIRAYLATCRSLLGPGLYGLWTVLPTTGRLAAFYWEGSSGLRCVFWPHAGKSAPPFGTAHCPSIEAAELGRWRRQWLDLRQKRLEDAGLDAGTEQWYSEARSHGFACHLSRPEAEEIQSHRGWLVPIAYLERLTGILDVRRHGPRNLMAGGSDPAQILVFLRLLGSQVIATLRIQEHIGRQEGRGAVSVATEGDGRERFMAAFCGLVESLWATVPLVPGNEGLRERVRSALWTSFHSSPGSIEEGPRLHPTQVVRVRDYVERELHRSLTVEDLSHFMGMSRSHFSRLFKAALGMSPKQFILQQRLERARQSLRKDRRLTISEVAADCGFYDQSHLTRHFSRHFGCSPRSCQPR